MQTKRSETPLATELKGISWISCNLMKFHHGSDDPPINRECTPLLSLFTHGNGHYKTKEVGCQTLYCLVMIHYGSHYDLLWSSMIFYDLLWLGSGRTPYPAACSSSLPWKRGLLHSLAACVMGQSINVVQDQTQVLSGSFPNANPSQILDPEAMAAPKCLALQRKGGHVDHSFVVPLFLLL